MNRANVYSFIHLLIGYCAILLISILSSGSSLILYSNNSEPESQVDKTDNLLLSSDYDNPFHDPFDIPNSSEPESDHNTSDEEETKDSTEDELPKWGFNSIVSEYLYCTNTESSVFHFISSFQNRQAVSLYILHHCWKSFLL